MVFGFVGFFIMGFAYQAIPRFKQAKLWRPSLALSSLPLMIAGIVLQTVAHLSSPPLLSLEILASSIQMLAVIIFAAVMVQTVRRSGKREIYDRFLYAALTWFVVAAIANPIIFKLFELPGSRDRLLFNLATFNIPYRDVELVGLAVVMILGISLRFLPHAYGFREPSRQWARFLFWGVNGSILIGAVLFIAGILLYISTTRASDKIGRYGFWAFIGFLVLVYIGNAMGPPPADTFMLAIVALSVWLLILWAWWFDKHRTTT